MRRAQVKLIVEESESAVRCLTLRNGVPRLAHGLLSFQRPLRYLHSEALQRQVEESSKTMQIGSFVKHLVCSMIS